LAGALKYYKSLLAELATKLSIEQPPGENFFSISLTEVDSPDDPRRPRCAGVTGTWDQVRGGLPVALDGLMPITGPIRVRIIQGQKDVETCLEELRL
jgi:hypothetical protein